MTDKHAGVILIGGCLAAGKTAFSETLSERLSVPRFNKDYMKNAMWERVRWDTREEGQKFTAAVFGLLKYIAEVYIKAGQPVILESNFRPNEAEELGALCQQAQCPILTFVFEGDLRVLHKRFTGRENTAGRGRGNRIFGLLDNFDDFAGAAAPLREIDKAIYGKCILVDTTDFDKVDFERLIKEAENFLKGRGDYL